ncbi:MAG: hypothetical protein LBF60_09070 [Treponema sp.]|jgi:MFS superfamily sulfate permease-like transporter|nr:hypothetical protein [Treponema sp.]
MRFSPSANVSDLVPRIAELFAKGGCSWASWGKDRLSGLMAGVVFSVIAKRGMKGLIAASTLAGLMPVAMRLCGLGKFINLLNAYS